MAAAAAALDVPGVVFSNLLLLGLDPQHAVAQYQTEFAP